MPSTVSFVGTSLAGGAPARVAARLVAASGRRNCMSPRWSTQAKPGPVRVEEVDSRGNRRPKSGWVGSMTSISASGSGARPYQGYQLHASNAGAPYITMPKRLVNDTSGETWRA